MIEPVFSSDGGAARLRARLVAVVDQISELPEGEPVDVHIMTFAFTDPAIAARLERLARDRPDVAIRIIADWRQFSGRGGHFANTLAKLGLKNLAVRYKIDQPYQWDPRRRRLRWSYRASRGLLHHKTLGVCVDGRPWKLVCGSYNWTRKAARSYETLLVLDGRTPGALDVMWRMDLEFRALWQDGGASMSPGAARLHHDAIFRQFVAAPGTRPVGVPGLGRDPAGGGEAGWHPAPDARPSLHRPKGEHTQDDQVAPPAWTVAFSSRSAGQSIGGRGYAPENRNRRLGMRLPSGRIRHAPLSLTALALDTVFRAPPGGELLVAMYGISWRIPEYSALMDAAKRGVRLRIATDGRVGRRVKERLEAASRRGGLPIQVRAGCRMMHQKYVLELSSHTVLTGTASLTVDATARHSEHLLRVQGGRLLARAFAQDFEVLWKRLEP